MIEDPTVAEIVESLIAPGTRKAMVQFFQLLEFFDPTDLAFVAALHVVLPEPTEVTRSRRASFQVLVSKGLTSTLGGAGERSEEQHSEATWSRGHGMGRIVLE